MAKRDDIPSFFLGMYLERSFRDSIAVGGKGPFPFGSHCVVVCDGLAGLVTASFIRTTYVLGTRIIKVQEGDRLKCSHADHGLLDAGTFLGVAFYDDHLIPK